MSCWVICSWKRTNYKKIWTSLSANQAWNNTWMPKMSKPSKRYYGKTTCPDIRVSADSLWAAKPRGVSPWSRWSTRRTLARSLRMLAWALMIMNNSRGVKLRRLSRRREIKATIISGSPLNLTRWHRRGAAVTPLEDPRVRNASISQKVSGISISFWLSRILRPSPQEGWIRHLRKSFHWEWITKLETRS